MGLETHHVRKRTTPYAQVPALNFIGGATQCHHKEGIRFIGDAMPNGRNVEFEGFGHFLYWEDPERFNKELATFVLEHH